MWRNKKTRHSSTGWLSCMLAVGICCLVLVAQVAAEGLFALGKREGFVEFGAESDTVTSSAKGVNDLSTSQRRFAERVGFRGDANLVDPSFFTLTYGATFNFFQDRLSNEEVSSGGAGRLFSYNLEGNVLPAKRYNLTFFANRTHSLNLREFAGTSELLTRNQGATVYLKSFILPSTLSYRQEESEEDSRFANLFGKRKEDRDTLTYDGRNHWQSQDLGVHYELAKIKDVVTPDLSYRSQTLGVTHRYHFGEDLPRTLSFNLNYVRRGDNQRLSSSALTLNEEFDIQHTRTLSTAYHYILSSYAGFGGDTMVQTGAASLQHRLYESLRSELTFQATHSSLPTGNQRLYGGRANFDYRKKLPAQGTLLANLGSRYEIENDRIQGKTIPIFQEKHIAHIGIPFRLIQPRVIATSMSVSGESGAIIFVEGLDYLLRFVGEFTEVEVLVSSRIREGETLVVDYEVSAPPALKFSTLSGVFNIGPDFGWFYPYYSFERYRQHLLFGMDTGSLENLRAHTIGARFRWTGNKISALLVNEYRSQESRLLPYTSLQLTQVFSYSARHALNLALNFDEAVAHYTNPERRTGNGLGRLSAAWTPLPSVTVDAFASLRLWRDSIAVNENFQQGGVRLHWSVSKFTASFTVDRDVRIRDGTQSHEFRWFTSVVRRF